MLHAIQPSASLYVDLSAGPYADAVKKHGAEIEQAFLELALLTLVRARATWPQD